MKIHLHQTVYAEGHDVKMLEFSAELKDLMKKYDISSIYGNWAQHYQSLPVIKLNHEDIWIKNFIVRFTK